MLARMKRTDLPSASLSDFERRHLPASLGMLIEVALDSESAELRDFAGARLRAYREDALYQAAVLASSVRCGHFTEDDLMQLAVDITYAAQASHVIGSLLRRVRGEAPQRGPD
ncbi:MAG: hypothetical protein JWN27_1825 [Candidatus Eremiobacteraeota bacterium]|nr:hypothetical protein [Candidatus Eremiobacteraeota bacterium]